MNPNPYEVSEPELLRGQRVSWRDGFFQDRRDSHFSWWTFHHCQGGPIWAAQATQDDRRSDLEQ